MFSFDNIIFKSWQSDRNTSAGLDAVIWEGMTHMDLGNILDRFFTQVLGENDHSRLIESVFTYADFNNDNLVSDSHKA